MSRESEIIQRAAAEFIHDRHRLGAFVGGLLRDAHAAEDVIQEVWVRLAKEVEKATRIENQPAWCRGVARNLILKHWRSQKTAKVVADSEVMEAFLAQVETAFSEADENADDEWQRRQQALDDCVAALPEKSRRMLSLLYELVTGAPPLRAEDLRRASMLEWLRLKRRRPPGRRLGTRRFWRT